MTTTCTEAADEPKINPYWSVPLAVDSFKRLF